MRKIHISVSADLALFPKMPLLAQDAEPRGCICLFFTCIPYLRTPLFKFLLFSLLSGLCILRSMVSLCPPCSAPGESSWPVLNVLSVFDLVAPSVLCHPEAILRLSSLPFLYAFQLLTEGCTWLDRAEWSKTWSPTYRGHLSDSSPQHPNKFNKNLL